MVGVLSLRFEDPAGKRPLATRVWYPAVGKGPERELALTAIFVSHAVPNAPMAAAPARLPLILLSHGSGGTSTDLCWLAEHLAGQGYLVAAVEHVGNRYGDDSPEGFIAVWRRPPDVSRLLDALLVDPRLGARVDAGRIGAAGFSAGGYTVLALAGGIYHPDLMRKYGNLHPNEKTDPRVKQVDFSRLADLDAASRSYRDERIRAVFAMAPAVVPGFDAESLAQIRIPLSIVVGVNDEWLPVADNAQRVGKLTPGAQVTVLPTGGHFIFMPLCNALGVQHAPEICVDKDPVVDRKAIHETVRGLALSFFNEKLR